MRPATPRLATHGGECLSPRASAIRRSEQRGESAAALAVVADHPARVDPHVDDVRPPGRGRRSVVPGQVLLDPAAVGVVSGQELCLAVGDPGPAALTVLSASVRIPVSRSTNLSAGTERSGLMMDCMCSLALAIDRSSNCCSHAISAGSSYTGLSIANCRAAWSANPARALRRGRSRGQHSRARRG
jgi:hypothetical protein